MGEVVPRNCLKVLHEEADCCIIHQISWTKLPCFKVSGDDTDILILLSHYVYAEAVVGKVIMGPYREGQTMVDINVNI